MHYDLVFEGGGAKGMAFAGAMREFEAAGHTVGRIMTGIKATKSGAITSFSTVNDPTALHSPATSHVSLRLRPRTRQ